MSNSLFSNQITLDEALEIVSFEQDDAGTWYVYDVHGDVHGDVEGNVWGSIWGDVGSVHGIINGKEWMYVETPKDKLKRLIEEGADKEQLLEAFNQLHPVREEDS